MDHSHAFVGSLNGNRNLESESRRQAVRAHHPKRKAKEFLVAIPIFNEARHIERVLGEVRRYCRNILAIDDGSTDETPLLLQRHPAVAVITHQTNHGYGKSLADAFSFAHDRGYQWLITMDCDGQHEARSIPLFRKACHKSLGDVISGSRYLDGANAFGVVPPDRLMINRLMTDMIQGRLDLRITDAFCGFKAYRVSTLSRLSITEPGYAMPMQFWVQVVAADLRIAELPVRRIYNDPHRYFGGSLDDPRVRVAHYVRVFEREIAAQCHRLSMVSAFRAACP